MHCTNTLKIFCASFHYNIFPPFTTYISIVIHDCTNTLKIFCASFHYNIFPPFTTYISIVIHDCTNTLKIFCASFHYNIFPPFTTYISIVIHDCTNTLKIFVLHLTIIYSLHFFPLYLHVLFKVLVLCPQHFGRVQMGRTCRTIPVGCCMLATVEPLLSGFQLSGHHPQPGS